MRRLLYIFISLLIATGCAMAQKEVSSQEKAQIVAAINKKVASINTMQCNFVQQKKLSLLKDVAVSKGLMAYKQGGKLRWEYTSPTSYIFVLNGEKVTIKSSDKKNTIDVKKNKIFQEVTRIMMSSITGQCLTDTKTFAVKVYSDGKNYYADLQPQKKEMKQMLKTIRLHINKAQSMVTKVEMTENKGDVTSIELKDIALNKAVGDNIFILK